MKPYPKTVEPLYYTVLNLKNRRVRRQFSKFDAAVSWAEKRLGVKEWFEFQQYGWSNEAKTIRIGASNNRIFMAAWFKRRPRKQTIGRRKAIIESLELRPDVTWPEIISALEIRDETSFQIRLAELRRTS